MPSPHLPPRDQAGGHPTPRQPAVEARSANGIAALTDHAETAEDVAMAAKEELAHALRSHARLQEELQRQLRRLEEEKAAATAERDAVQHSTSWRLTRPLRVVACRSKALYHRLSILAHALGPHGGEARTRLRASLRHRFGGAAAAGPAPVAQTQSESPYGTWVRRFDTPSDATRRAIAEHAADPALSPITVVMRVAAGQEMAAVTSLKALQEQIFARWTVVLTADPACDATAVATLRRAAAEDARITIAPGASTPVVAEGPVLLCEPGVLLREHGLYLFAAAMAEEPGLRLAYADEDRVDAQGSACDPFFKPDYSPELLRSLPYLGPCVLLGPGVLESIGLAEALQQGSVAAVAARIARAGAPGAVAHIPQIAYHVQGDPAPQQPVVSTPSPEAPFPPPSVSIIIPTRDKLEFLRPCLDSIAAVTDYPADRIEIIVVDNGSTEAATLTYMRAEAAAGRIRLLRDRAPFNFARLNNRAAHIASGEILLFLNDDTVVIEPGWLRVLTGFAVWPEHGAIGCKLLYPDGTVQHGGVVLGIGGAAAHAHVGLAADDPGYHGLANATHETATVTGACLAMRRALFEELGGFDEHLPVTFNDTLLCLDAMARGYRNLYVGMALLEHHESKSRGPDNTPGKLAAFRRDGMYTRRRHPRVMRNDPYYNPNLSLDALYGLAEPPRRPAPWRRFARRNRAPLRVLMLSATHTTGDAVAVVLGQQAAALQREGFEVIMAGPAGPHDMVYAGCERVTAADAREAACLAQAREVDVVVAHTPPFFSAVRWLGPSIRFVSYDHGAPPPLLFDDALARQEVKVEKDLAFSMADRTYAISAAVRDAASIPLTGIIPFGTAQFPAWGDAMAARRTAQRRALGWDDRFVVLCRSRFCAAERRYKGIDTYAEIAERLAEQHPELSDRVVFALCGQAQPPDVADMQARGLMAFADITDTEVSDLFAAADAYMTFPKWEGYNLGIGQALAAGLPVMASDIAAHREFPIATSRDPDQAVAWLAELVISGTPPREAVAMPWNQPLAQFVDILRDACDPMADAA